MAKFVISYRIVIVHELVIEADSLSEAQNKVENDLPLSSLVVEDPNDSEIEILSSHLLP